MKKMVLVALIAMTINFTVKTWYQTFYKKKHFYNLEKFMIPVDPTDYESTYQTIKKHPKFNHKKTFQESIESSDRRYIVSNMWKEISKKEAITMLHKDEFKSLDPYCFACLRSFCDKNFDIKLNNLGFLRSMYFVYKAMRQLLSNSIRNRFINNKPSDKTHYCEKSKRYHSNDKD